MGGVNDPGVLPAGVTVDAVDWLPSGAHSGLVRVRGHREPGSTSDLPDLVLESGREVRRFVSLPDPRADRDPAGWRGAYVLDARPAAEADQLRLEWPGGGQLGLGALAVPAGQVVHEDEPPRPVGEVVDRAVLAERRARKASASEQAQARIAREALRAVEVLELQATEIEERLGTVTAERDALRERVDRDPQPPDLRAEALEEELQGLRADLTRRDAEPVPESAPPLATADVERRAERLRHALASTIATVGELRLRLHESDVVRRTRDVAASAESVRLAVVEHERRVLSTLLAAARADLRTARSQRDASAAELEDLCRRSAGQTADLQASHERIAALETEVTATVAEAERAAAEVVAAAREQAEAVAAGRAHERELEAAERVAQAEAATGAVRDRLGRAEAALAAAETARELAEAAAIAAIAQRRAAEVAHAVARRPPVQPDPVRAVEAELASARAELEAPRAAASADVGGTPGPSTDLLAAAAGQVRAAADQAPAQDAERVAADISAAADALRARTPPTIVSAPSEPPADIARGRSGRAYPPLRGALVKLAHDDSVAAGRLILGLLTAQHLVVDGSPDYDLTIAEVGTFAVSTAGASTLVSPVDRPRGRPHAGFHLRTDALTLAELFAGVDQRPRRRRGPVRASGSVRRARRVAASLETAISLADLVRGGATLDPALALRAFAYAVPPTWTLGQDWALELHVGQRPLTILARHSGGLQTHEGPCEGKPDARVRMSADAFRDLLAGATPDLVAEGDEQVVRRLLTLADRARGAARD